MAIADYFNKAAKAATIVPTTQKEANVSEPTKAEAQPVINTEASTEQTAQLQTALSTALADKLELQSKLDAAQAELNTFKTEAQVAERTAQLSAVLPEDQVASMLTSTATLDSASFGVILGSLTSRMAVETETFKEVGFAGADTSTPSYVEALAANAKSTQKKGK